MPTEELQCIVCGSPLTLWQRKFCSLSCTQKYYRLKRTGWLDEDIKTFFGDDKSTCRVCGKIFHAGIANQPYCSKQCRQADADNLRRFCHNLGMSTGQYFGFKACGWSDGKIIEYVQYRYR